MTKQCFKCGGVKELTDFYKHPQMLDGHVNKCKECNKRDVRGNYADKAEQYRSYDKRRQKHSRRRIFNHRYNQIKQRIEGRATRKYSTEGTNILTYEEYCMWIKDNIDDFERLYETWAKNDFKRGFTPSIDRIDNKGTYTPDNMRWLSQSANSKKGRG